MGVVAGAVRREPVAVVVLLELAEELERLGRPHEGGAYAYAGFSMADWEDVRRIALAMPQTSEGVSRGLATWVVRGKLFVWERPLRGPDLHALGDQAPDGPILGARVEHLVAKEALLADDPKVFFTTPHFDGYPAVLVRLDAIERRGSRRGDRGGLARAGAQAARPRVPGRRLVDSPPCPPTASSLISTPRSRPYGSSLARRAATPSGGRA